MKFADLFTPPPTPFPVRILRIDEFPTFNTGKNVYAAEHTKPLEQFSETQVSAVSAVSAPADDPTPPPAPPIPFEPPDFNDGDSPHVAGWFNGSPVFQGTQGEWRASWRAAVRVFNKCPMLCVTC